MSNFKGLTFGLISGVSFGLIPLFSLPLLHGGMPYISVLFYRFIFAATALGLVILARKGSLKISLAEFLAILPLSLLYAVSSIFLLWGYTFVAASVATPIHFLYPVMVAFIMGIFFGEKITFRTLFAIAIALVGVLLLSSDKPNGQQMSLAGIAIVVISAVGYALYIVAVRHSRAAKMDNLKLTFYVMLLTSIPVYIWAVISSGGVGELSSWTNVWLLIGLALFPTVAANLALLSAVRYIGSTATAILGAMEPLTAVAIGVFVFAEPLTENLVGGVLLIIAAVAIVILGSILKSWGKKVANFIIKRVSLWQ